MVRLALGGGGPRSVVGEVASMLIGLDPEQETDAIRRAMFDAREHYRDFMRLMYPYYLEGAHITLLREKLEAVERGDIRRLIVTMPPRHSKSLHVSESFPAWYLGRNPDNRVIAVSHTQDLAEKMSYRVRQKFFDPNWPFPMVRISRDRGGVKQWDLEQSPTGGYVAVGVGGSPVGLGGDLIIIDDPIKSQADASSALIRERLWDWYSGTLYTRRQPGAAIIVTACMTGDTEVTMADGGVKLLKDIVVGDEIATYDDGRMTTSRVLNWADQGPDQTYEIRMRSGTIIRANARHPFLVAAGDDRTWTRVKDLTPGMCLLRAEHDMAPIVASSVPSRGATKPRSARAFATGTTASYDGRPVTGRHHAATSTDETPSYDGAMASPPLSMTTSWSGSAADAPSVVTPPSPGLAHLRRTVRTADSLSTTTTPPVASEGSSATTATSPSATSPTSRSLSEPFTTSGFTPDEIVSIEIGFVEHVYDIEVERTENFIADGYVSHNTRWHEDDLTGRLLQKMDDGGEAWEELHLPAQFADGSYLWPEFWSVEEYEKAKAAADFVWLAQYQGRPSREGGNLLREEWFPDVVPGELVTGLVQTWDCAEKPGITNDYSVCATLAITPTGYDLIHLWRDRVGFPDLEQAARDQASWITGLYPNVPYTLGIEDKSAGTQLIQTLRAETSLPVVEIAAATADNKVQRVIRNTSICRARRVRILARASWRSDFMREIKGFPNEAHDDIVDAVMMAIDEATGADAFAAASRSYTDRARERAEQDNRRDRRVAALR